MDTITELLQAITSGDLARVQALVGAEPGLAETWTTEGVSMPLFALYVGQPEAGQWLLGQYPKPDFYTMAAYGLTGRIRRLLKGQPELVNQPAPDGFSALGLAAFFGQAETARLLIEWGAEVDLPSNNPQRVAPLHSAAASQSLEIARLLMEHGADVNARQAGGFTALHAAAQNGQGELVKLLLAHGADASARTEEGRTALEYAREGGKDEVIALLGEKRD